MAKNKEKKQQKQKTDTAPSRGFSDVLPRDSAVWKEMWRAGNSVAELHGCHAIETPALESVSIFEKIFGKDRRAAEKSWYVFKLPGSREKFALRPTGLFPLVRSYIQHHLGYFASPLKVFFRGSAFSREDDFGICPSGEFRELGFSILGDNDPVYDIETVQSAFSFLKAVKIRKSVLKINTNGCRACKAGYRDKLRSFCAKERPNMCKKCAKAQNPYLFLSCGDEKCATLRQEAPLILNHLCQNCNNHFKTILELLEEEGIVYELDPNLVRDGDAWNRFVFSVHSQQGTLLALGGRFDYVSEALFGRQVPAVGNVIFLDRVADCMKASASGERKEKPKVFFVAIGDHAKKASVRLINLLREGGVIAVEALGKKSLKMQLKTAERMKVPFALLLGQKEAFEGTVIIRDTRTGAQETVVADRMVEVVKKKLKEE